MTARLRLFVKEYDLLVRRGAYLMQVFFDNWKLEARFKDIEAMKQQGGKLTSWYRGNHSQNVVGFAGGMIYLV
ncbi:MAG: hypothetical protein P4N59_03970 [Negativicutes bacterium]|nr:hypothetical protein [Negativicutes bacterium]